ncbi:hypothetical protein ACLOJK_035384 [Asimina triloba]
MDRYRGGGGGGGDYHRPSRNPSRWSSSSSSSDNYHNNNNFAGEDTTGGNYYNNPPPFNPHHGGRYRGGGGGGGGSFSDERDDGHGHDRGHDRHGHGGRDPPFRNQPMQLSGQKRGSGGFPVSGGRGGSPDRKDTGKFAKLFIGSVPRTAKEEDIRPLFEEHGKVVEVALIKDKRTGQQQGVYGCFCEVIVIYDCPLSGPLTGAVRSSYLLVGIETLFMIVKNVTTGSMQPTPHRWKTTYDDDNNDHDDDDDGCSECLMYSPITRISYESYKTVHLIVDSLFRTTVLGDVTKVFTSAGCCFIKYATPEEADRAIRALHNQCTLPGGVSPIQVRYADGERERLGAVEFKLFVGGLNRQATEKEVEEIFAPFGHVEDVYLMRDNLKQSRGCGFVKFSNREMAEAAIDALNGTFMMRGCDQPLIVRFADPKRPRGGGESRFGPAFGGPGFGPRSQSPFEVRPTSNLGEPMGGHFPPNAWRPVSPRDVGPSSQINTPALAARGGFEALPSAVGSFGVLGGPSNGSLHGLQTTPSSTSLQNFGPSGAPIQSFSQQMSPLQKPVQSPQNLPPSMQLYNLQSSASFSQAQTSRTSTQLLGQLPITPATSQHSFGQLMPSQHLFGLNGKMPFPQPQIQPSASSAALQTPLNFQQQGLASANQQQLPPTSIQQQLLQPVQQSPSQQVLAQQQTQALPSSMQSPQQAVSQLQQQLHIMQPSSQGLIQQQNTHTGKSQSPWSGIMPQMIPGNLATAPASAAPSATSAAPMPVSAQVAAPSTCNWTEHTSPEGFKYYYNSVTSESKWEKPEEFTLFEQQQKLQQQHKYMVPQLQSHPLAQMQPPQQISQMQQMQSQILLKQQQQQQQQLPLQQPAISSSYQASGAVSHQSVKDLGYGQVQPSNSAVNESARFQQARMECATYMAKTNYYNDPNSYSYRQIKSQSQIQTMYSLKDHRGVISKNSAWTPKFSENSSM